MRSTDSLAVHHAEAEALVTQLEDLPVGWRLQRGLEEARGLMMDAATAVRAAVLWLRLEGHVAAQSMVPICEAVDAAAPLAVGTGKLPGELVAAELAVAMKVPLRTIDDRVAMTEQVSRVLDSAWTALDRGQITLQHLKRLSAVTAGQTPRVAMAVEQIVIPQAVERDWTPAKLAAEAEKALLAIDPEGAADRAAAAKDDADVTFHPQHDGMATTSVFGEAAGLRIAQDAIEARAAEMKRNGDQRPIGQRRVAAYLELVLGKNQAAHPKVHALVTMDLTTWLGLNERPGELSGYGPITAELARELAQDSELRRMITDPVTGHLLDLGLTSYRPSEALRRFVEMHDQTCRFPGCHRRATHCDVDHWFNFGLPGGVTSRFNLHTLCRHHHNLKTRKLWRVSLNVDGSETWCSPFGFLYTKPAAAYPLTDLEPPPDPDDVVEPPLWVGPMPRAPEVPVPPEPPLDHFETDELYDVLDNSIGEFQLRAYNLLRAAQLIA